jgi:uncharacterized protein YeaC (DUF1315 family)
MPNEDLLKTLNPATVQEFEKAVENIRVYLGDLLTEQQTEQFIQDILAMVVRNELNNRSSVS